MSLDGFKIVLSLKCHEFVHSIFILHKGWHICKPWINLWSSILVLKLNKKPKVLWPLCWQSSFLIHDKSFWKSIRSLRDGIFIPPHAVSLDPLHKTNLTTQKANGKRTELTQCQPLEFPVFEWWPGQVLLSEPKKQLSYVYFQFCVTRQVQFPER